MNTKTTKHWLFLNQIQGHIAMWAVRQSPYHSPAELLKVLSAFGEATRSAFDDQGMAQMDYRQIETLMKEHLYPIVEFQQWNERKNGRQGPGFCSRYDEPHPDDDFIDLDALIRNARVSLIRELERDAAFDRDCDRRWKWGWPIRKLRSLKWKLFQSKQCPQRTSTHEHSH